MLNFLRHIQLRSIIEQTNNYLRLIRYKNLIIIALMQYTVRYCMLKPHFRFYTDTELQLNDFNFFLLVLSTMLVAAAGYIINDYFDIKTDWINRPKKVILGRYIKRSRAIFLHIILNAIAFVVAVYLSILVANLKLILIYVAAIILLWSYSTYLKKTFLIGNIIVSLHAAIVPLLVWFFEISMMKSKFDITIFNFSDLKKGLFAIAFFAFFINLIREIIKDIEDIKGDRKIGCKTIPIKFGIKNSEIIILAFSCIVFFSIVLIQNVVYEEGLLVLFWYLMIFVQIPLILMFYIVPKANKRRDYSNASNLVKFIMFTGIFAIVVFHLTLFHIWPFNN
ncbi:MAG: geranylgeranylglycerol-phosphate geranylgeranyltransferase [Bacteroidales bacterium]|nr:geranylgeranylglycerol-phosphate geranylgeranyltransferase [Bacteroidales bacterium]